MDFTKGDLAKSKLNIKSPQLFFLCHVTFYFYSKYTISDIYFWFDSFIRGKCCFEMDKRCYHIETSQRLLKTT